jgi:hypothetical protein
MSFDDRSDRRGWLWAMGLLVLGVCLALSGVWTYNWIRSELVMRQNFGGVIAVINYNLQTGAIKLPPEMQPQAAPPAPPRPPAPTPVPPPGAKAP